MTTASDRAQPTAPASRWAGWHRATRRHPWRRVALAPTEQEAFRAALDATLSGDVYAAPEGIDPNEKRR
jgi:hypothetical protein